MADQEEITISKLNDDSWTVSLSKQVYEKPAILAAAYKFHETCLLTVDPDGDTRVSATFRPRMSQQANLEETAHDFCREVLDQQHRLDLDRQFGHLRDLIVEHAFTPIANLKDRLHES
jgi:His-Xaa-Ser system protein HxsD